MAEGHSSRLRNLGYELPAVPEPAGSYVPAVRCGNLVFTAGQLPLENGRLSLTGRVGGGATGGVTLEEARQAARLCALNALAAVAAELEGLDAIRRIVKVTGYVASAEGFNDQARVLNGASEFLGEVLGEAGPHARSAVGVAELPLGAPVEVELIAEVADPHR